MSDMEHLAPDDVSAYLDGELPPAEGDAARSHLEACPECRAQHDRLASVARALGALPRPVPSEGEREAWRAAVQAELAAGGSRPSSRAATPRWAWPAAAAAAVALIAGVGLFVARRPGASPPGVAAPTVVSPPTTGDLSPGAGGGQCHPEAVPQPRELTTGDIEKLVGQLVSDCAGKLQRRDVATRQRQFTAELSRGVPNTDACAKEVYDQMATPLIPVFAQPARFNSQDAVVIVFLTTLKQPATANDLLDSRQAFVLQLGDCAILDTATQF